MNPRWKTCIIDSSKTAAGKHPEQKEPGSEAVRSPASAEALNWLVSEADQEWLAFVSDTNVDRFRRFSEQIAAAVSGHSDRGLLLIPLADDPREDAAGSNEPTIALPASIVGIEAVWKRFPPQLAALVQPPERQAVVLIRRKDCLAGGAFRDLPAPVWDRVIRQTKETETVAVLDGPWGTSESGLVTFELQELPELAPPSPGKEQRWLKEHLRNFDLPAKNAKRPSRPEAIALQAGCYQIHDFLDESHAESQSIEGEGKDQTGDYWHGIMHRREPDPSNSKYWFRHVGRHPVFGPLGEAAKEILSASAADGWTEKICSQRGWDPFAFVDFCEECRSRPHHPLEPVARGIQWLEMLLLLGHSSDDALTST